MNNPIELPQSLELSLKELIVCMSRTDVLTAFMRAKTVFESDMEAQKIIRELNALQSEMRKKQYSGQLTQQEIDNLRNVQNSAQENEVIMEYVQSQQEAIGLFREVNTEISQLLGMDFAALAKQTRC